MSQGVLPFKYDNEKTNTGMTALAGLPVYLDLAKVIGLRKSIEKHLKVRKGGQGWTDNQIVLSLVLLNLTGGDYVDEVKILEADDDFGENAAWWWIMVLSHNLNAMMKKLATKGSWLPKRMKAVRFFFINLPGRVIKGSRSLLIRLTKNNPSLELLINARKEIAMLQPVSSG